MRMRATAPAMAEASRLGILSFKGFLHVNCEVIPLAGVAAADEAVALAAEVESWGVTVVAEGGEIVGLAHG